MERTEDVVQYSYLLFGKLRSQSEKSAGAGVWNYLTATEVDTEDICSGPAQSNPPHSTGVGRLTVNSMHPAKGLCIASDQANLACYGFL